MDPIKFKEIIKYARTLKNNLSYCSVKLFLEKYKTELDLNYDKLDILIKNILNNNLLNTESITLQKLNLKYKKTSKEYWIIRGWDINYAIEMAKKSNSIYSHKLRLKNNGYTDAEIKQIVSDSCKKGVSTLKKREDYLLIIKKRNKGLTKDRYLNKINQVTGKKYTESESHLQYIEDQKKAGQSSRINMQHNKNNTRIEYYLDKGLSKEEAASALFERQIRNGLNYYINKYGIEIGTEKYKIRIGKYSKKIKELRKTNPEKWIAANGKNYSDSSKRFFDSIINEISDLKNMNIFYADNEYCIYDSINNKIYFYDFYIEELNLIIEYNGIVWHPKERVQENWRHPYTKETSEKFYDLDKTKEKLANDHNLDLIKIFEDEIITKKQILINELYKRIDSYKNT